MTFQLPELPVNFYAVVGLFASAFIIAKVFRASHPLDAFPTVGSNNWFDSWWAGLKFLTNAQKVIQEGYEKHNPAPFKIAEPLGWTVILTDRRHMEELARASEDELSVFEAAHDRIQIRYTMGHEILRNPYHITIIRSRLTRNLDALYPDMMDEIVTSFGEVLDLRGSEWKSVPALDAVQKIVCRTSNRVFVGLPLCRNPDWIDLNVRYTLNVVAGGIIAGFFPEFMKPLAVRFLTNIPPSIARGVKLLGPIIEDRRKFLDEYGKEWNENPNDLLSWLMDEAEGPELTTECLTTRILVVNFAVMHTSSHTFTQALFYLAANPQYIQPLREEVERIVEVHGWTKTAVGMMHKIDSFLKESTRISGIILTSPWRKALTDFTFSDGTVIPKGTLVAAPTASLHRDRNFYVDPDEFRPFRFSDTLDEDGRGLKQSFISGTPEYVTFGIGRYSCPGRFFAAAELKSMLAYIVVTYDVKLEDNTIHPPSVHTGVAVSANSHARVMFRNREH